MTKHLSGLAGRVACAVMLATSLQAQSIYGTLTGIISDPTQAVVANATLKLKDEQSGSQRETKANGEGYYTFVSLPPGIYQLTVTSSGFDTHKETGIKILGGDKINVNVGLKIGNTANTVVVTGDVDLVTPVDSGEKTDRLTTKELESFIQVGTNAAEFIKIMPGFGISNGTSNGANYTGGTAGINGNGGGGNQSPLNGAYSYNGLPGNSLDITADGAHVSDPGCNCATPVNPNSNMISEFKISMSNFNAENQKGPGVISSVSKGGGKDFHGSAFMSARNGVLNSNDWLNNFSRIKKPENAYYYPGFTIGGPVILPGTRFNKNRDKLFFHTGFQYHYQILDTGLLRATVPTLGERQGNFSNDEIAKEGRITQSGAAPNPLNAKGLAAFPGGIIPPSLLDKNTQALMNLYAQPNADPNSNGGFNWVDNLPFNQNMIQSMSRMDYSISDNTKLFVRYNQQKEVQLFPIGLWSAAQNQSPYPSKVQGKNRSDSVSASLTKVFSSSMTNEVVFGYTFIGFPNVFENPDKVDRTKIGYNYKGLFKNGVAQFPHITGNGEMSNLTNQGGFEVGGPVKGLYANKYMPTISDTVAKVAGKHTMKAGIFYEWIRNAQPANNNTNGTLGFNGGQVNTYGNPYADFATGNLNTYSETSFNRINDIYYHTFEGFLQDSWKVNRRLTLELGLRITHFTPWTDNIGFGFATFDFSKFNSACKPVDYCGFVWNARDPKIPLGGFKTRSAFYQPRFGVAYALGNSTVLRGGWGRYYYHSGQFTTGLNVSSGMQTVSLTNNQGVGNSPLQARDLDTLPFATTPLTLQAVDKENDRNPYTDSYSFTISRRVPWSGLVEVAYVGNQSRHLLNTAGGTSDLNRIPVGAMLASNNPGIDPNTLNANTFRPLQGFGALALATNNLYANYNSVQTKYQRSKGRAVIMANYTFGKAMGILSPTLDSFNLDNNYGVQANNRKHIFNAAYSYEFKKFSKNALLGGLVNSWQISGVTQIQSGVNLTGQRGQNFGMALNGLKVPGTTQNISNTTLLGTPNIQLNPILTCDPRANLVEHQFINNACFAYPTQVGQNGPTTLPAIYGPAFFNSDLGLFKNFNMSERKKLQFRANAYNFMNHPLFSFNGGNLNLGFNGTTGVMNTPLFGYTTLKQGRRVVQLAATFMF